MPEKISASEEAGYSRLRRGSVVAVPVRPGQGFFEVRVKNESTFSGLYNFGFGAEGAAAW